MRALFFALIAFSPISAFCGDNLPVISVEALKTARPYENARAFKQPTKVVVGEPTSSLSKVQAMALAKQMAAAIPGAVVAEISSKYDGRLSPAISSNSLLIIEPCAFEQLNPFDFALFKDAAGGLRARRVLAKGADFASVGYELNDETTAEVGSKDFVGRVVGFLLFNPNIP